MMVSKFDILVASNGHFSVLFPCFKSDNKKSHRSHGPTGPSRDWRSPRRQDFFAHGFCVQGSPKLFHKNQVASVSIT